MILNTLNIKIWALFFLMAATQIAYFIPVGGSISMLAGIMLFLLACISNDFKLKFTSPQWVFLFCLLLMVVLGLLLLFYGVAGEFKSRNIFQYSLIQLVVIILTFDLGRKNETQKYINFVFVVVLVLESIIVLGQFLHMTFGFGFSKIVEHEGDYGLLTGSMGNPNDSAAQMGALVLAITAYLVLQGRKKMAYVIIFIALPGIFFTLSRTMLVFLFMNLLAIYFSSDLRFGKSIYRRKYIANDSIFVLTMIVAAWIIYTLLVSFESDVIMRALLRAQSIGDLESDDSVGFRFMSHLRLWDNFGNLGMGSFSDLNYYKYFEASDPWLMKVNPHSYIVEYSFLFGYCGIFVISAIIIQLMINIFKGGAANLPFKLLGCCGVMFVQAVPASLLVSYYFFVPFVFLWSMRVNEK